MFHGLNHSTSIFRSKKMNNPIATKKILLLCVIFGIISVVFLLFLKEESTFKNKNEFVQSSYAKEITSVNKLVSLIPESAKNINLIYKENRMKNIMISFDYLNIEKDDYVYFLKTKLKEYSAEISTRKNKSITIVFRPVKSAYFLQIDVDISDKHIIIQTY